MLRRESTIVHSRVAALVIVRSLPRRAYALIEPVDSDMIQA